MMSVCGSRLPSAEHKGVQLSLLRLGHRIAAGWPRCSRALLCQYNSNSKLRPSTSWKEQLRKSERAVFTFDRWVSHRSTSRYARHLTGLMNSKTFQGLWEPTACLTLLAVSVCIFGTVMEQHQFVSSINFNIDEWPFELTSFALSLLLVFKTDSSYARYDEAIKAWNSLKTSSKELVMFSTTWIDDISYCSTIAKWVKALPRTLKVHVTDDGDIREELRSLLEPQEVERIATDANPPQYILHVLATLVSRARLHREREEKLTSHLDELAAAVDACERILKYPIPLAYTRHTSRFMIVWLGVLPLALWRECGWAVIPVTAAVSYLLLGIDEIGVQIEEPFAMVFLEDFCRSVDEEADAALVRIHEINGMFFPTGAEVGKTSRATVKQLAR